MFYKMFYKRMQVQVQDRCKMKLVAIVIGVMAVAAATVTATPVYRVYTGELDFEGAVRSCKEKGGDLATPATSEIEQEMISVIKEYQGIWGKSIWINLQEDSNNKLINGQIHTNYAKGNPNCVYCNCVAIYFNNMKWYDYQCTKKKPYICKVPNKPECCYTGIGEDYRGTQNVANNGKTCIPWNHKDISNKASLYQPWVEMNYCRNPSRKAYNKKSKTNKPWCYTRGGVGWDYCDVHVPKCNNRKYDLPDCKVCCYSGNGKDYKGTESVTADGRECREWENKGLSLKTAYLPKVEQNFCRNPSNSKQPWCYTVDGSWGYCNIPQCTDKSYQVKDCKDCCYTGAGENYMGSNSISEAPQCINQAFYVAPKDCKKATCTPECKNGGYCTDAGVCICIDGWFGNDCSKEDLDFGGSHCTSKCSLREWSVQGGRYNRNQLIHFSLYKCHVANKKVRHETYCYPGGDPHSSSAEKCSVAIGRCLKRYYTQVQEDECITKLFKRGACKPKP